MKTKNWGLIAFLLACLISAGVLFAASGLADDHGKGKRHFQQEGHHRSALPEKENEGNETAGQLAAWLFVGANLTIALSTLIKWTNGYLSVGPRLEKSLGSFNRFQKQHLRFLHYYLNPAILGIVLWHWLSSHCKSSALPEIGLVMMVILMGLGISLKFKLLPPGLRKRVYQMHTHPVFFLTMIAVLLVGHTIVD